MQVVMRMIIPCCSIHMVAHSGPPLILREKHYL